MNHDHLESHLMWVSPDKGVAIVDIPRSIEEAQWLRALSDVPEHRKRLFSCMPLQESIKTPEPKAEAKRRQCATRNGLNTPEHEQYERLCQKALTSIHEDAKFCYDRAISDDTVEFHDNGDKSERHELTVDMDDENYHHNPTKSPAEIQINHQRFTLPARSACLIADCSDTAALRTALRDYIPDASERRFELIVVDPPWPNRSARRKAGYGLASDYPDIKKVLKGLDLDMYISPGGYVAVWITNSPAARQVVLGPGGLFESCNLALHEEWLWLKTTQSGQPMTPIDGVWRRPYEVLLIGRAPTDRYAGVQPAESIRRRVVVAVPDLHSRKPCLKALFEKILIGKSAVYKALEIFSRHMVSGWFSWGNEACKFNEFSHWIEVKGEQDDQHSTSNEI